jgi:hypothetical protein
MAGFFPLRPWIFLPPDFSRRSPLTFFSAQAGCEKKSRAEFLKPTRNKKKTTGRIGRAADHLFLHGILVGVVLLLFFQHEPNGNARHHAPSLADERGRTPSAVRLQTAWRQSAPLAWFRFSHLPSGFPFMSDVD